MINGVPKSGYCQVIEYIWIKIEIIHDRFLQISTQIFGISLASIGHM